ncbi:hypothetical protein NLJ89_g2072 [Agrocybe chaxingu]|uniref:DNA-directed RNA polymerase n=1 Tax=Agrocybe chaxingu TaxID=84603 RepID=A0A9W8MYB4_9AGAR|nr:hypothetical protein NLJ89_g2072 [Agrocybe chaxingu]
MSPTGADRLTNTAAAQGVRPRQRPLVSRLADDRHGGYYQRVSAQPAGCARARGVFQRLRTKVGSSLLETRLYNAFLEAYIGMARKEEKKRSYWIDEAWRLYDAMEEGLEEVLPNANTYSLMLLLCHQVKTREIHTEDDVNGHTPGYLLGKLVDREIPVMDVVSNATLESAELMTEIAKMLSSEAVNLGFKDVLQQLGHTQPVEATPPILKDVPEVMPVYKTVTSKQSPNDPDVEVPFNLSAMRRHLSDVVEARKMLDQDLNARQKHLEASVYDLALEHLEHRAKVFSEKGLGQNQHLLDSELQKWMWTWHLRFVERLKVEVAKMDRSRVKDVKEIAPYMTLIKPEKLSLLTILEVMRLQGSSNAGLGMKTTRTLLSVGKAVENEYKAQMCKKHDIPVPEFGTWSAESYFSSMGYQHLRQRRVAAARTMEDGEAWTTSWSQTTRSRVGAVLVECLMDVAEVLRTKVDPKTNEIHTESQPAFFHGYEYQRGQKLGVLKLNPIVTERMAKDSLARTVHPRHLPMLVKPRPWLNYNDGGYIYNKCNAMRFKDSLEQEVYLKEATNAGTVELVYAGLDILGSTPWRINKPIFDIVLEVWNSGERMGKIPPAVYDQPEPVLEEGKEKDMEARSHYMQRHRVWAQEKGNNHSERCSVNYKIEIARAFLADTIYLPHNLDFRGRAYPIPPHLNHIGDDLSRALLKFEVAKPLGERGFRWLKIHLANLYGYDKANFDERVQWVEDHVEDIIESATNPLTGSGWWKKADDPWQCLATCIELKNALALEDPTTYECSLPVHQDGTCNGLQHYAALGGDAQGARQVNLAAADRPSDVYTHISLEVESQVKTDAEAGNETAQVLLGKITRKVVKQTVMTTVYGVTFVGAREQIERQLRDRPDIPEEKTWAASSYLAKKVMASIGDTFRGAKSIQLWLNLCARLIAKSIPQERLHLVKNPFGQLMVGIPRSRVKKEQMTSVIWTTALGLPIVQPYRKTARKQVMTAVQSVYISDPHAPSEVNAVKQATAFPPNFIHSLDATHMMLTALECRNQNLTFASVHDSYWTHACDVDQMSSIIRDTFIALHSSDILRKLEQEFRERYKGYKIPLESISARGGMIKQLAAAGTRIKAFKHQKRALRAIKDIVEFTDEESSVAETTAPDELDADLEVEPKKSRTSKAEDDIEDDDFLSTLLEGDEGMEEEEGSSKKGKKSTGELDNAALLEGKFVSLTDLIPPLPDKGTFNVQAIKSSQYFFS